MCVHVVLYHGHISPVLRGPSCDANTHLWLKQAPSALSCIFSAHLVLPSPGDGVCWVGARTRRDCAVLQADVHHCYDISIQTAGQYLVEVSHRQRCIYTPLCFSTHDKASFTHFSNTQHFPALTRAMMTCHFHVLPGIYRLDVSP